MASQLAERIRAARAQGEELEAVLDSMSEALLALDGGLGVVLANPAAVALFGLGAPERATGRSLLEAARSTELEALARRCVESGEPCRAEIALGPGGERWFRALAAPFRGTGGLVLLLEDETERRRLERVRRDFVANVSHELRTPVQVIKGFAESLDGILDGDGEDLGRARRYVAIVSRNASRMESLIGDLLALAALERDGARIELEDIEVGRLVDEAIEAVAPKAEAKGIAIEKDCPTDLLARLNPGLVVQALVNLIDNAVKYSPPGRPVLVAASSGPEGLALSVRDRGMGIPAKDLGRLFERFYRVDKARSRELGGTGLGLAIVKHIAMAHGGSASVESWEGEGSTFRIAFPGAAVGEARKPGVS
jgi:two-component system phosphate regulon sensor histidine kinase PhoR